MGLFWDLIQQSQISDQRTRASSLEDRVTRLESDLHDARRLVRTLLERLEKVVGEDINEDGEIG